METAEQPILNLFPNTGMVAEIVSFKSTSQGAQGLSEKPRGWFSITLYIQFCIPFVWLGGDNTVFTLFFIQSSVPPLVFFLHLLIFTIPSVAVISMFGIG